MNEIFCETEQTSTGVNRGPSWHTMIEIAVSIQEKGAQPSLDASSCGDVHAVWGTHCVSVPASVFWPWAAGLVGIEVVGTYSTLKMLVDFDPMESSPAVHTIGLHVHTADADWKPIRDVSLSVGEFWDAICALAGAGGPTTEWLQPTVSEDWG